MFIGMVLIPPVLLKLASTGYRFVRYYTGSQAYRAKGPPPFALRLMAPVLVVTTLAVLTTGVLLLATGHKSGALLEIHKVSFIVWLATFAVHFLVYIPRVVRSLRTDWSSARRLRPFPERAFGRWWSPPRSGEALRLRSFSSSTAVAGARLIPSDARYREHELRIPWLPAL